MEIKIRDFTDEEKEALIELAQERIRFNDIKGNAEYRNRFETWDDAYINLKHQGFPHENIIERIGEKPSKNKE